MTESPARFPYGTVMVTPAAAGATYIGRRARGFRSGYVSIWPLGYVPHPLTGGRAHSEKLRGSPCNTRATTLLALRICCSALVAPDMHTLQTTANKHDLDLHRAQRPAVPQAATCRYGSGPTPLRSPAFPHHTHYRRARTLAPRLAGHSRMSTADAQVSLQGVEHSQQALSSVQRTRGLGSRLFQGRTSSQVTDVIDGDFVIASADRFDGTDQVHLCPRRGLRHLAIELCLDDSFSRVSRDDDCHAPPPRPAWPRAKDEPRAHALDGNLFGNSTLEFQEFRGPPGPSLLADRRCAPDRRPWQRRHG